MARKLCSIIDGTKPVMVMVAVQLVGGGNNIFFKLAVNDGMSTRVLVVYRFLFATAFISPLAFILERKSGPRLTRMIALQGLLCGLFGGALGQNLYLESLALTSATFSAAMANLVPAVTFIFAVSLGLEKLEMRTWEGKAKVFGTLLSGVGAMVLTFYKGPQINTWSTHVNLLRHHVRQGSPSHHVLGSLLAVASCFSYATWLIIQAKMGESYPLHYSSTALMCASATAQATVYATCMERSWSAWKLGWNIRLLTVAFAGSLGSGLMMTLVAWCLRKKGPLFVSVFSPLILIFVALLGSLLLDENLHLGSIIGGVLIVVGLYALLWAKGEKMKSMAGSPVLPRSSQEDAIVNVGTAPAEAQVDDDDDADAGLRGRKLAKSTTQ